MKTSLAYLLLPLFMSAFSVNADDEKQKAGRFFTNLGMLTNWYLFDSNQVRRELPSYTNILFNDSILSRYETDTLNYNIGIGYYVNENISVLFNYSPDLSFGDFEGLLGGLFSIDYIDTDLDIYDLEIHYRFLDITESFYLYSNFGISYHHLDANINDGDFDEPDVLLSSESIDDTSLKAGLGVQWDYNENFGIKIGYSKSDFLSIDKSYLHLEFRF